MLSSLERPTRELVGEDIGRSIYSAIGSPLVTACLDRYSGMPAGNALLQVSALYRFTGESQWLFDTFDWVEDRSIINETPTFELVTSGLAANKYGIPDSPETRLALCKDASDLLCEVFDDSFYWFDKIAQMEQPNPSVTDLVTHPVLPSAIGLHDKVHRTVKEVYDQIEARGIKIPLPRSRLEFVTIFEKAPDLLLKLGLELEVDLQGHDQAERGLCPANTRDSKLDPSWYQVVASKLAPFYLASRQ